MWRSKLKIIIKKVLRELFNLKKNMSHPMKILRIDSSAKEVGEW